MYRLGQKFVYKGKHFRDETFILARVSDKHVCLISLDDGNRWNNPKKTTSSYITEDEFKKISKGGVFEKLD